MALAIERLEFRPWGCFSDHPIELHPELGIVDLIYGENASGKSTTSRGERSLLYGIEEQTPDNHSHEYAALRIGARLLIGGETVELTRRKKQPTLLDPEGNPLGADPIVAVLGGLSEEVYRGLFMVDHETLVQGGIELLEGGGEIGASLFAAAAGISHLHETLAAIDDEADAIYKPRGRSSVLNRALRELTEAEKALRDGVLRPRQHQTMTRALASKEEHSGELSAQIREIETQKRMIERRRIIAPQLDGHADRSEELAKIGTVPELADGAAAQRIAAQGALAAARRQEQQGVRQIADIEAEIVAVEVDEDLLALAEQVQGARDLVVKIESAAADRRKREGELGEAIGALRRAAAVVGVAPEGIPELERPANARREFDRHVSELIEARAALSSADGRRRRAREEQERAAQGLGESAEESDLRALEASIAAALKAGSLGERIAEMRAEGERRCAQAEERLELLRPRPTGLAQLREVLIPSEAEIVAAIKESEARDRIAAELSEEELRLERSAAELGESRERLAAEGEVPSAEVLADARKRREMQWTAVRREGEAAEPLAAATAERFEQVLAEADEFSDRRLSGATRVERSATQQAGEKRLEQEGTNLVRRREELSERAAAAVRDWTAIWRRTDLEEISPRAAAEWTIKVASILDLDREASESAARALVLSGRQRKLAGALGAELASVGETLPADLELEPAIAFAQRVIEDARERAKRDSAAAATLKEAERQLSTLETEHEDATAALEGLLGRWPGRLEEAGLPAGSSPEAAQEIVRSVEEGHAQIERVNDLKRRIAGIDADREAFEAQVSALHELVGGELDGVEAPRAAEVLHRRLREAEGKSAQREGLREQRQMAQEALVQAQAESAAAESTLEALVAVALCESVEKLPAVEERWARSQELRSELREIERQVVESGEGKFAELLASAEGFDRDAAAIEIEQLEGEIDRFGTERDRLQEEIGEDRAALSQAESDPSPAAALQQQALLLAEVEGAARRYAIARLGAAIVRRAMERYRGLHQDPLLQRANELFSSFTLGTFTALEVDVDAKGRPVLIGREGEVGKTTEQMSKGTREQLFLALRLAAIERYVTGSGSLPVIFDDVFIESDEPRSEQIFRALGVLAQSTQVIVLTHHRHLIDVGGRALGDALLVQKLPDVAPPLHDTEEPGSEPGQDATVLHVASGSSA